MRRIVQKFGGTSVKDPDRLRKVAEHVIKAKSQGQRVLVVLSAMNDETDRLVQLGHVMSKHPDSRELDALISTGEQVSTALLSLALLEQGYPAKSYTGFQAGILTDSTHQKARILDINATSLLHDLDQGIIPVVAGFQGMDKKGNITTLGRGGSDTSAVALAAAIQADECQIFTDVEGVYTADPRIVKDAKCLSRITFEEMLELSSLGAKVLQNRALEFASKYNIPLRVLSSFNDSAGTLVTYEDKRLEKPLVSSIAVDKHQALFYLSDFLNQADNLYRILQLISQAHIDIDMLVQKVAKDHKTVDMSFAVSRDEHDKVKNLLKTYHSSLRSNKLVAKLSVVGLGMRSQVDVPTSIFRIMSEEGIPVYSVSTSEIKISLLIEQAHLDRATQALHQTFGLGRL